MKIEIKNAREMSYDEITDEKQNVKEGDILLIKKDDSDKWVAQFVTLISNIGIYLHPEDDGLDGGDVVLWPEYVKEQHLNIQELYAHKQKHRLLNNDKFIHIAIDREE